MAKGYVYRKPVKRSQYSKFRRYLFTAAFLLILFGAVAYFIYSGLQNQNHPSRITNVEKTEITGGQNTFTNDYFTFQDTGTWVLDKNNSNATKLTYEKFNKSVIQAQLVAYINQDPIPLYAAVPRALPVRIVNDNSLAATNVSSPCVNEYAKGAPHKVQEVAVDNATILCDPDSPQYFIALSEVNGDYHLHLKNSQGKPIEFVITYKDDGLEPTPTSIVSIANSFHTK